MGGAKCLGAEVCGAGKVKVIVLSDQYKAPDRVVLENVKAHIEEERQIGADVTVAGADPKAAHIVVEVQAAPGYNIADIRQNAITWLWLQIPCINLSMLQTRKQSKSI